MNKLKKHSYYWLPPLLTLVILMLTYIIKGVTPFGNANIAYYDMSQQYIPNYLRNYQILNGSDSLFFSWITGAGTDMSNSGWVYTINPINWVLFLVPKENIYGFMSFFLMLKLMLASFSMSFFMKKSYELPLMIHTSLCLMFTFSGYVVQDYTNIFFLDSMMLFPLLILGLKNMLNGKSELLYTITLTIQLIITPYIGFMTLLFVLFYSFGGMLTLKDSSLRKHFAAKVGVYTFTALAISAVGVLTSIYKMTVTPRTSDSFTRTMDNILAAPQDSFFNQKAFIAFNTGLAAALLILAVVNFAVRKKRPEKEFLFRVYMFVIMLMPILSEGVLLLWHLGSYAHFPYRNGYMLVFAAAELAAYQYRNYEAIPRINSKKSSKKNSEKEPAKIKTSSKKERIILYILTGLFTIGSLVLLIILDLSFVQYGIHMGHGSYILAPFVYILDIAAYALVMLIGVKKLKEIFIFSVITLHVAITSVCFIAPLKYATDDDYNYYVTRDNFVKESLELSNTIDMENDGLSRIKTLNPCLALNYPGVLGLPSISEWTNEVTGEFFSEISKIGYHTAYIGNLDSGGTIFSDALINDKKLLVYGDAEAPEQLYSNKNTINNYSVYDLNYTLPCGMLVDEKILDVDTSDVPAIEHQNKIYHAFSDDKDDLISVIKEKSLEETEPQNADYAHTYKISAQIKEPSVIYACSGTEMEFVVNGSKVNLPYYDVLDNNVYPQYSMQGIVTLGTFDSGDVEILINTKDELDSEQICVGVLELSRMKKLEEKYESSCASSCTAGKNSLTVTADVNGNNYLFLPVEYLKGWSATVNGAQAEILPVLGNAFMAVKLPDGHCEVELRYTPSYMKAGACLSVIGILVLAFLTFMKKKGKDICDISFIKNIASLIFTIVSIMLLIFINLNPVLARLVFDYKLWFYLKFMR